LEINARKSTLVEKREQVSKERLCRNGFVSEFSYNGPYAKSFGQKDD